MQMLPAFVTGLDVLSGIIGWKPRGSSVKRCKGITPRMMVLAAEHDVLCTPAISLDAATRYRRAFREAVSKGQLAGLDGKDLRAEQEEGMEWDGVQFGIVPGVAHHMQNEDEWARGAEEILGWIEGLSA
jgi:hypothetical protein